MTTVLSVIQRVCPKIGIAIPTAVFGSTEREHIELAEMANDVAEKLVEDHDWQALTVEHTITGDGVTEIFDFPDDYDRMILNGNVWNSRTRNPVDPLDLNTFLSRDVRGFDVYSAYVIIGNQIRIQPIMEAGETVVFHYIKTTCIKGAVSVAHEQCFTSDDDEFILDNRLLRLGMIWQWRESKGLPYAEDMENYERALMKEVRSERGSKLIVLGGNKLRGYKTAYPRAVVS